MLLLLLTTLSGHAQEIWEASSITDLTKDVQTFNALIMGVGSTDHFLR